MKKRTGTDQRSRRTLEEKSTKISKLTKNTGEAIYKKLQDKKIPGNGTSIKNTRNIQNI